MADIEYIIPGSGIVNDTEEGAEVIIPGFGVYQEQEAAASYILTAIININLNCTITISAGRAQ